MTDDRIWSERLAPLAPEDDRNRAVVAGLVFGLAGMVVGATITGGWVVVTALDRYAAVSADAAVASVAFPLSAGLGAAVAGTVLWGRFVERPGEPTTRRGALVGAGVGVLAHPGMWAAFVPLWGLYEVTTDGIASSSVSPEAAVFVLLGFLFLSAASAVVTGVVTVPVAAAVGVGLARVRARVGERPRSRPRRGGGRAGRS